MVGTFWLVLGGCGSAVLAAAFPGLGIAPLLGAAMGGLLYRALVESRPLSIRDQRA